MFDKEFYPTPSHVIDIMQIDCQDKTVLEPSAGSGHIVKYLLNNGAKQVQAYEKSPELSKILSSYCSVLGNDFLKATAEELSHINLIVMNPPFSNADKHINHAYDIAPEGCEIIALCNYKTIESNHNRYRDSLHDKIRNYGTSTNLGDVFSTDAERTTGIEIGLIRLFKPIHSTNYDFDTNYFSEDEEVEGGVIEGVMKHDEITHTVQRYIQAVKSFDKFDEAFQQLKQVSKTSLIVHIAGTNGMSVSKDDYMKRLQKDSWKSLFSKLKLEKYVTTNVMKKINNYVEVQTKYPFTTKNINKMFEVIVGTMEQSYSEALEEAIDNFTRYTHENRFAVEGWKTNSSHMLNRKFIVESMVNMDYSKPSVDSYRMNSGQIEDLNKVLCNILGMNYNDIGTLGNYFRNAEDLKTNKWYKWGFFEFKFFKKRTMHLKFIDKEVWYKLNKAYGELKGFTLPENI